MNKRMTKKKEIKTSRISVEGIIEEAEKLVTKQFTVEEILDVLLARLPAYDPTYLEAQKTKSFWRKVVMVIDNLIKALEKSVYKFTKIYGQLYVYNGTYWKLLESDKMRSFLTKVAIKQGIDPVMAMYSEFVDKLSYQLKSVVDPVSLPKAEKGIINLANGTLEIDTEGARLREFRKDDIVKYIMNFSYEPFAEAPIFSRYLNRVLPQKELQMILAEFIGYIFLPSGLLQLEKALLLYGKGANGKSVFFNIINALLGKDNISNFSLSKLTDRAGYTRAMITNKMLNYASEINHNIDHSLFKQLVSGEPIEARLPFGKPFIAEDYARLMFNTNELPKIVENDRAYFRRLLIIPFEVEIPPAEQDVRLSKKIIKNELPGVLNWVIEGLKRLLINEGFTDSKIIDEKINDYKQNSDTVILFMTDNNIEKDLNSNIRLLDIYNDYKDYCNENNYKPYSNRRFRKHLEDIGVVSFRGSDGVRVCCRV
jgi:putative DNA primase/helicase